MSAYEIRTVNDNKYLRKPVVFPSIRFRHYSYKFSCIGTYILLLTMYFVRNTYGRGPKCNITSFSPYQSFPMCVPVTVSKEKNKLFIL